MGTNRDHPRASTNGHLADPGDLKIDPAHMPATFGPVAGWLVSCCLVLAVSASMPGLWARQVPPVADGALRSAFIALATLAAVFLPMWAPGWRIAAVNLLSAGVVSILAGAIEGATADRTALAAAKLTGLLLGFATIWIATRRRPAIRRFVWLLAVIWALGAPAAVSVSSDWGGDQGTRPTFLHGGPAGLLRESVKIPFVDANRS